MPVYVFVKIIIISLLQLPPSEDVYFTFALSRKILYPVFIEFIGIFLTISKKKQEKKNKDVEARVA